MHHALRPQCPEHGRREISRRSDMDAQRQPTSVLMSATEESLALVYPADFPNQFYGARQHPIMF